MGFLWSMRAFFWHECPGFMSREERFVSRLLSLMFVAAFLAGGDLSAERWLVERGPAPAELAADDAWLAAAAELLLRADLAELRGVALVSKADVKSDILTLELNRLASASGDDRTLLGKFARAKALVVIEFAGGGAPEVSLRAIDLTPPGRERTFASPMKAESLDSGVAKLAREAAEFLGRAPTDAERARMDRASGLSTEALAALAGCVNAKTPAERELLAKRAVELAPESPLARYLLARELHAAGRLADAISAYREANRLDDAMSAYHYDLGNAFFDDKRYDEALAEYARAIALDPEHAESHENYLRAQKSRGLSDDDVLAAYRAIAAAHEGVALVHLNAGRLLARLGKLDESIAEMHKACDLAPKDPVVRYDLAHVLEQAGKEMEAFYEYKEAVTLAPNYAKALNNLGRLYETKTKDKIALFYYTQAVRYAPDYALAWSNLGILYGKRNQRELEVAAFRRLVALTPADPVAHYNLGVALQKSGDAKGAIVCLKKALELAPDDKPAHWQLAFAYERAGMMNLAAQEWRKVLALNPTPEEKATAEKHLKDIEQR